VKAELYLCTWLKPVTIWSFDRFFVGWIFLQNQLLRYVYCITVVQENAYMQCSTLLCSHWYHSILPFKILMEFQDMCTHTHIHWTSPQGKQWILLHTSKNHCKVACMRWRDYITQETAPNQSPQATFLSYDSCGSTHVSLAHYYITFYQGPHASLAQTCISKDCNWECIHRLLRCESGRWAQPIGR
jgi:hypothetical protein